MKNHTARRERERNELRLRILTAASELFQQGGEPGLSLRRVAEKIEFSATAIYLYFPNKEALLAEICVTEFEKFARRLQLAEHESDAMLRLRKVSRLYVDFGLQHPGHYRVLFMRETSAVDHPSHPEAPTSAKKMSEHPAREGVGVHDKTPTRTIQPFESLQKAVFKAMAAGCFKAEYRDVSLISQALWSCLHGVVALHLVRAQHPDVTWKPVQSILDASLECFLNGSANPACQIGPTWQR